MIVVAIALSLPFIVILFFRPVMRRLALRNAIRRPRETLLVIAGSMLATALMTAAFVVGDTFDASLRANAYTQLGPIDEVVSVPLANASALDQLAKIQSPEIDGVLRATTTGASAAVIAPNGVATAAAPKAQLLELDFAAARRFGGDAAATGISGAGPRTGEAVLAEPLAKRLNIGVGDQFNAYAFGHTVALRVVRLLPQSGVAGWWNGREFVSYNAFVAPGTIAGLAANSTVAAAPPQASVLVSNLGGVESGDAHTTAVVHAMKGALAGASAKIEPVKHDALDLAKTAGQSLTQLDQALGFFAVVAGILLLVNIFVMLAEERRSELGMLRAMGMKRRSLVGAFASEGWLYAVVACAVGMLVGLGVGRLVMAGAARIFNSRDADFRLPIRFHFTPQSLQIGFTLGLVVAVTTIVATTVWISRFNIIAAIRDLDSVKHAPRDWVRVAWGVVALLGAALVFGGVAGHIVVAMTIGGALLALGLRFSLRARMHDRSLVTATALGALVWGVAAVPIAVALGGDLPIEGFIVQGVVLVIAAVVLVTEYQGEIGGLLSRASGRRLSVRLGLAYPLARRTRTMLTIAQFAIVVFILVYISVLASMFGSQVDTLTAKVGGGANVYVESNRANPVPFSQLQASGAQSVAPLVNVVADVVPPSTTRSTKSLMTGFDASLLTIGAPKLADHGPFKSDGDAYRYVLAHPNTAMVDDFFLSQGAGPPASAVSVGDVIRITDPLSGHSQPIKIVARSESDWLGNGGITSAATLRGIYGPAAVASHAYVRAASPESFSRALEARYYAQGAKVDPIRSLVSDRLSRQRQFFTLMRAFLAVGLVIGVAGIGVIMVRAVRERRRQVGVLRSLGFPAVQVSNAFAIEAMFIALEGVSIGVVLGFLCTWSITLSDSFGDGLSFRVPVVAVGLLVVATLFGALLATWGPARSASKIKPAVALRIAD
jgi:putative ABC transport system permease protein